MNGRHVVLSLLREHAERDASRGFAHLIRTLHACQHPRLASMRESIHSMIQEAASLSQCEMSDTLSRQQFQIASSLYQQTVIISDNYRIIFSPTQLIKSGKGYRLIDLIHGAEFNYLPGSPPPQPAIRNAVAKAVFARCC